MALFAIMLDPIVLALGVISYLAGRNWGWPAAAGAVALSAVVLFLAMLAMGGAVAVTVFLVYLFGIAAWAGLCYLAVWLSSRLRTAAK